ncbi:hypothetical protein RHSIM_Rhsim02G0093800 [Rhododendron simsii]|uniref:AAA+ ATPase domain-containing protein n=1 Tax=Rhododendron simsii TaxID=118357 RepID=A0A834H8X8_RHOSS|nr:hypothetical protein RHSIM_Rhsim02G0093800 [Rhododendron simsii]
MSAALIAITGLGKIAGSVLVKIGDYVVAPIGRQFTYMLCFNSNITEVEAQLKELEVTREGVQMGVDDNRRKVRVIGPNVEAWLKSANEVSIEVGRIIQEKPKVKEGCLNGWCPNIKLRYSLSKKAVKTTKVVIDLQARGVQYTQLSYSPPPPCLATLLNRDFMGFESRSVTMEEIIKALKHDYVNLIGVCGMGGVGKTTMVNEVAKRAKEENHFDEVAMAVVSKDPDLTNVQVCIADMLGLKNLSDTKSPIARADLLCNRLLQDNKKVLVILDDIWEDFDLQAMGIPLECANKNFKLLYTSRTQDLWHDVRTKKEIPLQLLPEDEAWQLFREKAGDSADARDLLPIAKQIVNECGGLPLALVLIGGALSTKSGRNPIKEIWEGMLDKLICASRTPANERLFSRLELSYKYLDEEAKRLFLLCCLFREDEDIRINDLAMYGLGLSLFDGINEMGKARRRVFLIVDDLKSRYLLLDSKYEKFGRYEECVRVHDVVRDMGISIAAKDKVALVSHGALSEWPKTVTCEPYTAISVISDKITKLPEGLTYPNLEFLILRCRKLEKLLPNFFEGMGKLKVLEIGHFDGILMLQSLRNLTTLSLEGFRGRLNNLSIIGGLLNLETLNFRHSGIEELPEEIGELVNLRLLDLRETWLCRIPPGVISRLVRLEELYMDWFEHWEGEDDEAQGRNANLIEFESLSNLNTLEIEIRRRSEFARVACIPTVPIFSKLEIYKVFINNRFDLEDYSPPGYDYYATDGSYYGPYNYHSIPENCKRRLGVNANDLILSHRGGIDSLLRRSEFLSLQGSGCDDLVRELLCQVLVDGLQQLKHLYISYCHVTQECLVNAMNPVQLSRAPLVFPILEVLWINQLDNVREISRSPIPAGSFGELTSIIVTECRQLRHLFQLPIVGCLPQLTDLKIINCNMMEEVIWREKREDVLVATNRIEFPKLKSLSLRSLPSLKGFCRRIDHIDFPQFKRLDLYELERLNCLFRNTSTSHSEENDNAGFLSLFPPMVSLPNLEVLQVHGLKNLERIGHGPLSMGSLSKPIQLTMSHCSNLVCVFPSELLPILRDFVTLQVSSCELLEVVFELEAGVHSNEPNPKILSPLKLVKLYDLPQLSYISKRDPTGFQYIQTLEINSCHWLRYVFAPTVTKSIPQLRTLEISFCRMLSKIVAEENGLGESSVDEVEFPRLEKLVLRGLPSLVNFFPNGNTTLPKSTDHLHTPMQSQPLFNEKVTFPSLKVLILEQLPNATEISRSPIPAGSFGELTSIIVTECRQLRHLFPLPIVGCLPQLTDLEIQSCDMMEEVIWREQREDVHVATNRLEFPKLESLSLWRLPSLKGFCRGIDNIDFPQLKRLFLYELERLNCLFHNNSTSHSEENNDAGFLSLFAQMVSLPNLEVLQVNGLKNLERIGHGPLSMGSLSKLIQFTMSACNNLVCVFPSELLPILRDLVTLQVSSCELLEVVFEFEAGVHSNEPNPEILSPLKLVKLYNLPKLSYISKRDPMDFQYIQTLEINRCHWLRYVFAPTVTKSIPQLRTLEISFCRMLSRIVAEENGLGESSVDEVEFPRLEKLVLRGLPSLVNFFPNGNATLPKSTDHLHTPLQSQPLFNEKVTFPSLEVLILERLPNVSDIWSSELPDFSFFKLKRLAMNGIRSLRNMSHPSLARVLLNLQTLMIDNCWKMEAVVDRGEEIEDGQRIKIEKTLFPQLTDLELSNLPNLRKFCNFTHPIDCHCHGSIR